MMVLPVCEIMQLIENIPDWNSDGWFTIPAYVYGVIIVVGLFFLQCYWSVILLRAFRGENKRNMEFAIATTNMK
jgi:hypothetical protein